ncbi:MAG: DUF2283 domain-containing protein [Actinomycetota bacterium]
METGVLISEFELLERASKRVKLPTCQPLSTNYDAEADALFLKYSTNASVISKSDYESGITRDFDADNKLVGIEILDLQGLYD